MISELPTDIVLEIATMIGPFSQELRKTCSYFSNIIPYKEISREDCLKELVRVEDIFLIEVYRQHISDDDFKKFLIRMVERPTLINIYSVDVNPYICAFNGNLPLLKRVMVTHENDQYIISSAARGGSLECLKYLHELGYPLLDVDCISAVEGGNIDCLRYLHEHGCVLSEDVFREAVTNLNVEMVEYLHKNNCPHDEDPYPETINIEGTDMAKCLHRLGYPLNEEVFDEAVHRGNFELVEYLHKNNCPWVKILT